jgi:hypothetical protein
MGATARKQTAGVRHATTTATAKAAKAAGVTIIVRPNMDADLIAHVRPFAPGTEEGCNALLVKSNEFLDTFAWAKRTGRVWVGDCVPGVLGLFLVELDPPTTEIDQCVWTVVGDLPPAYISTAYAKSPRAALDGYIGEMEAWVDAVRNGKPVDEFIPVNGAPTLANAEALKSRLAFLEREILPYLPGKDLEKDRNDDVGGSE